jgi:hypothetical protein
MDISENIACPSPLEQRRERLRAFADRVLEAVEALPMPKTAAESARILRTITIADKMLVQIYSKISSEKQTAPTRPSEPAKDAPFVYRYDDDGVDDGTGQEAAPFPTDISALDLERRANDIFQAYRKSLAAGNKGPP